MSSRAASFVLCCLALGCATHAAPTPAAPVGAGESKAAGAVAEEESQKQSPRALGARATFGDVVRLARSLTSSELMSSTEGCLVGRDGDGYVLGADLMPSLERMPDPPTDLGARFERGAEPFAVLTAWGIAGTASASTVLASFTATAATTLASEPVLLVLDGDQGFVRAARGGSEASAAALPIPNAIALAKQLTAASATLYLTTTAGYPLEQLAAVLAQLDGTAPQLSIALAVLLPTDTALPTAPAPPSPDACPAGLPEVDETTPLGDLARDAVLPALASLQQEVGPCLSSLRVPQTRVVIALRVGESGGVQRACFLDSGALDPRTASCVLLTAGALQTPAPNPRGVVDLHLPLTLATEAPATQRALCH